MNSFEIGGVSWLLKFYDIHEEYHTPLKPVIIFVEYIMRWKLLKLTECVTGFEKIMMNLFESGKQIVGYITITGKVVRCCRQLHVSMVGGWEKRLIYLVCDSQASTVNHSDERTIPHLVDVYNKSCVSSDDISVVYMHPHSAQIDSERTRCF